MHHKLEMVAIHTKWMADTIHQLASVYCTPVC